MAIIKVQTQRIGALWLNPGDIDAFFAVLGLSPVISVLTLISAEVENTRMPPKPHK